MTNSNWKPVPHKGGCKFGIEAVGESCWRDCDGTRWHGYGERVGDFAGVWALTGWLAGLRPEQKPVAWRWLLSDGLPDSDRCFHGEGPTVGAEAIAAAGGLRCLPRTAQKLYAAPVQPAAAQPVAVPDGCDPEFMAALARGDHLNGLGDPATVARAVAIAQKFPFKGEVATRQPSAQVPDDVARDAERFRAIIAATVEKDEAFIDEFSRLCPEDPGSIGHARLAVDAAMLAASKKKGGGE